MLIQITSGHGPSECELAVSLFLRQAERELKSFEIVEQDPGKRSGCLRSATLRTAFGEEFRTTYEGTIQWISTSPFRKNCRRKNWFVKVACFEENPEDTFTEKYGGILFQTFRSSGKGGQNVNKTETKVRAVHLETGISAVCETERSQFLNKKIALERLREKLAELRRKIEFESDFEQFESHHSLVRGNPKAIFEGINFNRRLSF